MRRFLLVIICLGPLIGCGAGISLSSASSIGLEGAPTGTSFTGGGSGGGVSRLSSTNFSGFVNTCVPLAGGIMRGGEYRMSDPLLEVVGQ